MTTPFEQEKRRIQDQYRQQRTRLLDQRREAEATVKGASREQLSALEKRQQELLGELRTEEQRRRRLVAIGQRLPRAPIEAEKRRIESEAKSAQAKVEEARKEALKGIETATEASIEELEKWKREAEVAVDKGEAEFKARNVQLDTGEWVPREDFKELPKEYQEQLKKLGIEKFNEQMGKEQAAAVEEQKAAFAEFRAEHVKLDTGEWVAKEDFEALDPQLQLLLKKEGTEKFEQELEDRFKAENVEVGDNQWIPRTEWESLSSKAQAQIRDVGWDAYLTQQEDVMRDLMRQGWAELDHETDSELPPVYRMQYDIGSAIQGGYDISRLEEVFGKSAVLDTQKAMYGMALGDVEEKFKEYLRPGEQKHFIGSVLVGHFFGIVLPIKGWMDRSLAELTEEEKRAVLERFAEVRMPIEDKWREGFVEFHSHLVEEHIGPTVIGITPVLGTIYHWDDMSPTWRAISIVGDIAVIGSFARAGISALRASRAPIRTAAAQLAKAETAATRAMVTKLRSAYSKTVANAYTKFSAAQTRFLERLAKHTQYAQSKAGVREAAKISRLQSQLEAAQKARNTVLARQLQRQMAATKLSKGERALTKLESQLRGDGETLARQLKPKAGFDSPEVARMVDTLGDDAVRNARAAVQSLGRTDVRVLQAAVDKAEKALKAAQARHPTDPSKWVDLLYDYAVAQGKLAQVRTGAIDVLYTKLLAARKAGKTGEIAKLEKELREAINAMEVEWAKGGFLTRGGGGVATEVKPWTPAATAPPAIKPTTAVSTLPAAIATRAVVAPALAEVEVPEVAPAIIVAPETIISPDIVTEADTIAVAATAPKVEGVTDAEIKTIAEATVKAATKAMVEGLTEAQIKAAAETAAQAQTKTATRTQVKTVVKTGIRQARKLHKKWRVRLWDDRKKRVLPEDLTPEQRKGAVAWRQGFIYKLIYPPYEQENVMYSRKPFPGIRVAKGPKSAYESITRLGYKLPPVIERRMGIMAITIKTPKEGKGRPEIKFGVTPKEQTRRTAARWRARDKRMIERMRPQRERKPGTVTTG